MGLLPKGPANSSVSLLRILLCTLAAAVCADQLADSNTTTNGLIDGCMEPSDLALRVIVLFDITPENATVFRTQQSRIEKTLRHIDLVARGRPRFYGLIAFHRLAVVLSGLNAHQAKGVDKIIDQIASLNPRRHLETSPTKALDVAGELIENSQNGLEAKNLVLLVHDGRNTDLIAETLEASARLAKIGVSIFAISGSESPNGQALLGYTSEQTRIFAQAADEKGFFGALEKEINFCDSSSNAETTSLHFFGEQNKDEESPELELNRKEREEREPPPAALGPEPAERAEALKDIKLDCGNNDGKVDLVVALDTSGSVFHSFGQQRQLALDLLSSLKQRSADGDSLHVGIVHFAAEAHVAQSLRERVQMSEMLDRVRAIKFTGRNTRIADAVEMALDELEQFQRKDALKVFVLVSDGHGQEFWTRAQAVGRRLQESQLQLFAVSASLDFNRAELQLYIGNPKRVFVGQHHFNFLPTISAFLNKCLSAEPQVAPSKSTPSAWELAPVPTTESAREDPSVLTTFAKEESDNDLNLAKTQTGETEGRTEHKNGTVVEQVLKENEENTSTSSDISMKILEEMENATNIFGLKDDEIVLNLGRELPPEDALVHSLLSNNRTEENSNLTAEALKRIGDLPLNLETEESAEHANGHGLRGLGKQGGKEEKTEAAHLIPNTDLDCPTDILFLVDRFSPSELPEMFARQMDLASKLLARIEPSEVASGKIRLGAISFGREPRLETSWTEQLPAEEFMRRLVAVEPARAQHSSFVGAVSSTLKEIATNHRRSARLLLFIFWAGINGRNTAEELNAAVEQFDSLKNTELFAVTLNPNAQLGRLKALVGGDNWHVFLEGRSEQFVEQASRTILDCVLPPSGDFRTEQLIDEHEPRNSVERVEHLVAAARAFQKPEEECQNDPVDLAIIMHFRASLQNESAVGEFQALRRATMDALRQAPPQHYQRRIRLSLITNTQQILSLQTAIDLDDALFAIDRIGLESGNNPSLLEEMDRSLADAKRHHRAKARLLILVLTNEEQQFGKTHEKRAEHLQEELSRLSASVFILSFAQRDANVRQTPIAQFSGKNATEFTLSVFSARGKMSRFVDEFRRRAFGCKGEQSDREGKGPSDERAEDDGSQLDEVIASDSAISDMPQLKARNGSSQGIVKLAEEEQNAKRAVVEQRTADNNLLEPQKNTNEREELLREVTLSPTMHPTVQFNLEEDHPRVFLLGEQCRVDLMLIIDTSQSVAEEFHKQLQFALDLVKRLPDEDFAQRVRVGAVSFHRSAHVQFPMGDLREKSAVLEALTGIRHTGGSTSVVRGVELAMDEVAKHRRNGTRLMVVLISDGNSQDAWEDVLRSADRLRAAQADVYAVTVSHDYFFRELELYAGNKWFVYIDARIRQFLDEAETSLVECKSPATFARNGSNSSLQPSTTVPARTTLSPASTTPPPPAPISPNGVCADDLVDLMFILDTSTSVERDFYAEKNFALDLVRVLPEADFARRLSISIVKFHSRASVQLPFLLGRRRDDIVYEIERIEHTGGQTSLVKGAESALAEIGRAHRPNARLIVVLITDGNSQDEWSLVQATAKKLREAADGDRVYAITLSEKYYLDELREYTGLDRNVYTDARVGQFVQEVGRWVAHCPQQTDAAGPLTPVPTVEASATPSTGLFNLNSTEPSKNGEIAQNLRKNDENNEFAKDEESIQFSNDNNSGLGEGETDEQLSKCRFTKMDLIIILDASTSRESVFEHQRELALSLIERLPISRDDTHVATGINSFTNVPVLRQTLGLGRDRKMVRKAIEDIKYRGGSTLTSKAVELALQDLQRGRRPDALQVVVLMNDGMSQDNWERVLETSKRLADSKAERFGVALGEEVDLRELRNYIGNDDRIYRDGSTERFLNDVAALLDGGPKNCSDKRFREQKTLDEEQSEFEFQLDSACEKPKMDLLIVLDNTDPTPKGNDPKLNANRYLLLDVLGSLPLELRVQVSVVSVAGPRLEYRFSDPQDRESLFKHIEGIRPVRGEPSYAEAVEKALDYYAGSKREDSRGLLLLVGDGNGTVDSPEQRRRISNLLRNVRGLSCHAVDSGNEVDVKTLAAYTGSPKRIYPYDRNAEFAKILLDQATASEECRAENGQKINRDEKLGAAAGVRISTSVDTHVGRQTQLRDIAVSQLGNEEKTFDGSDGKLLVRKGQKQQRLDPIADSANSTANAQSGTETVDFPFLRPKLRRINRNRTISTTATTTITATSTSVTQSPTTPTRKVHENKIQKAKATTSIPSGNTSTTIRIQATTATTTTTKSARTARTPKRPNGTTLRRAPSTTLSTTESTVVARTSPLPSPLIAELLAKSSNSSPEPFRPGCVVDLLLLIDASGSVEPAFQREKELAAEILTRIRVGPNNARVAIVKFAAPGKVRTVHPFSGRQDRATLLRAIDGILFSDGTTALDQALQQAIGEFSPLKGARPGQAEALAIVFTDGFSQHDFSEEAHLLRRLVPNVYALAVNGQMPIALSELAKISGDAKRVFMEENVADLYKLLRERFRSC